MPNPPELKAIKILEITWFVIAIGSFALGLFDYFSTQNSGIAFFIFSGIAGIMFFLRRKQRKKMEN